MTQDRWLRIYVQDHAAAEAVKSALLRRIAQSHGVPEVREAVAGLIAEAEADEVLLLCVMSDLGMDPSAAKEGATLADRMSRLMPNGRRSRRSPLSDVVEIEALTLALTESALGWTTLAQLAGRDSRLDESDVRDALDRTLDQRRRVEVLRRLCIQQTLQ